MEKPSPSTGLIFDRPAGSRRLGWAAAVIFGLLVAALALGAGCDQPARAQTLPGNPSPDFGPDAGTPAATDVISPDNTLPNMQAPDAGSPLQDLPDVEVPNIEIPDVAPSPSGLPAPSGLPGGAQNEHAPGPDALPRATSQAARDARPRQAPAHENSTEKPDPGPLDNPTSSEPAHAPGEGSEDPENRWNDRSLIRGSGGDTPPAFILPGRPKWV